MNNNILTVVFGPSRTGQTRKAYQYDYGMVLKFPELSLPAAYEVHFANKEAGVDSVTQIGDADGVSVPDAMFISGDPVYVWIYLHTGQNDGETVYRALIPVVKRSRPSDATPDPVQQSEIDQAIAALNAAVTQTAADVESAAASAADAEASAAAALASAQAAENSATAAHNSEVAADSSAASARASKRVAALSEQNAAASAAAAAQSATEAAGSASAAQGSATAAAGSETNAADSETAAAGSASAAQGSAAAAAASETNAARSATAAAGSASTASSKAAEAAQSATDADAAKQAAQSAQTAAEAAQDASISAKNEAVQAKNDTIAVKDSAVGDIRSAGSAQVGLINAAGSNQVAAVDAKGQEVIASIPADYTGVVNAISDTYNPAFFMFFDLAWENGTLDNNGAETADPGTNKRYRSAFIQPNSFETLVLFIPRYCNCYGYRYDSSKNFLGYVTGGWLGATADNQDGIVKIQSDGITSFYRFVFRALTGYTGSQRAITANDLSNTYCFHINRFPDDKSEISNLQFVIGAMEDYRNLTIPTNIARANTFFIPVASRHMVLSVPDGYQIYTWQLDGEFQYLRERGWSTGGMYYFLEADTKYIRFVAKTDNGSDTPSAEALKAVSVSFLSEIDKVPVNPLLRENTLIAHRGYSQTAPENTIPAIELAAQYGFKQVEVDLQFTSDGVCVLLHDNTINRTSDGTGNIYDMTYQQALQYDFGSWKSAEYAGTKIPTLKEALLCCKYYGMCAQLDIADTNKTNITAQNLQTMLDVIAETGMFSNVNICAEDDRARKVIALRPGVIMCVGVGDTEAKFNTHVDMSAGCALLIGSNSVATATDEMLERCHKNGMPYQIWTIDAADAAIAKFKDGYDWIITNSLKPTDVS